MKGILTKVRRSFCAHGVPIAQAIPRIPFEEVRTAGTGERPCILLDGMEGWPALQWNVEYLRERFGHMDVPVEISEGKADYRSMFDASFEAKRGKFEAGCLMKLDEYLHWFLIGKDAQNMNVRGYIAQCRLGDYLPELLEGVQTPSIDEVKTRLHEINFWLGPQGTETPLHRDPYLNLLCQIFGEKYVRLYDSKYSMEMYPFQNGLLRNTSQVDVENPDKHLHPQFELNPYWEGIIGPGEMLYIPQRWWHYVQSRTVSFSVNFWWNKSTIVEKRIELRNRFHVIIIHLLTDQLLAQHLPPRASPIPNVIVEDLGLDLSKVFRRKVRGVERTCYTHIELFHPTMRRKSWQGFLRRLWLHERCRQWFAFFCAL